MAKSKLIILILTVLIMSCNKNEQQGIIHQQIKIDDLNREYILYLPKNLKENSPLVFVCHGYTDSAENIMKNVSMNSIADEKGFAICYPQGSKDSSGNTFWEVGYPFTEKLGIDDVKFLTTLATHLHEEYKLSKENTFVTGMSNGADMCIVLACKAPEIFKAVAPVCGSIMKINLDSCTNSKPIPVFMINGTADETTWWDGDSVNTQGYGAYLSTLETLNFFVTKNNCKNTEIDTLTNTNTEDNSFVISEKHTNGINGNQVWLYKVVNGGHEWPGSYGNMDINTSKEVWSFFSQFVAK